MTDGIALLKRTFDATEAHMIKGFLEQNDITAFLMDEQTHALNIGPAIGGVRIMVLKEDLDEAQKLIEKL